MKKSAKKNENSNAVPAGTIDLTPTWSGLLPALVELYAKGEPNGRTELERMARIADAYLEHTKANKPDALREAGREANEVLESTERGRRVLDAVQRVLLPPAGGYGLDSIGLDALATVFRCVARGCFEGVVQSVPSEQRMREERERSDNHPSKPIKFVVFDPKTNRYLDTFDASRKEYTEWTSSFTLCMRMELHTAWARRHHIADKFGIECHVVATA